LAARINAGRQLSRSVFYRLRNNHGRPHAGIADNRYDRQYSHQITWSAEVAVSRPQSQD
ncbi:MAG: hypothetical protein ACI89J_000492, partial [Hyphomicrobiaceae bacterium]